MEHRGKNDIISKIINYVNSGIASPDHQYSQKFVFGNIAFSHDGEDKINIGSELVVGEDSTTLEKDLLEKNREFGEKLNKHECFSITKYLKDRKIKVLSIAFKPREKNLKLIPFDEKRSHVNISYNDIIEIKEDYFNGIHPRYTDDYMSSGEKSAFEAFKHTLEYYAEFHKITKLTEGYIYLIRPELGLGGKFAALAYMYLKDKLDDKDIEIISQMLSLHFLDVLKKKAEIESVKSAKAAIMSRNISHNLGSHVMSYLKQNLGSVEEMVKSGMLMDAHQTTEKLGGELPFLVGMGKFISYLQERQDYIATVATDYIPYQSVVNFKDAIYDELNPDYRFQRHQDNRSGYKPANILLENIAKSEGLSRKLLTNSTESQEKNNIFIKFGTFDGLNHRDENAKNAYEELRKWNFSLPGGIMGRQAVFSIVENVIRNAAKHGTRAEGESLSVTFEVYDPLLTDLTAILGNDAIPYHGATDIKDLCVVALTANTKADEDVLNKINAAIKDTLVDDDGNLKQSNKGIKEMLISAAWLRGIRIEDMAVELAPILKPRSEKGYLQYVFCLPKVKEVALVSDRFSSDLKIPEIKDGEMDSFENILRKKGWYCYTYEQYEKKDINKCFNFVIIDNGDKKDDVRKCSNNRFFVASDNTDLKNHLISTNVFCEISKLLNRYTSAQEADKEQIASEIEGELQIIEKELYRQLATVNTDEMISIFDKDEPACNGNGFEVFDEDEERIPQKRFIYRKHNDNNIDFLGFLDILKKKGKDDFSKALESIVFAEGISGGNSTDRLVRRETKDDIWAYKNLHAMKTKVAVVDERIFTKITGKEPSELTEEYGEKIDWNVRLEKFNDEEARKELARFDREGRCILQRLENEEKKNLLLRANKSTVVDFLQNNYPNDKPKRCKITNLSPLVFHKKRVDVYTITKYKKDVVIWGVTFDLNSIDTDTNSDGWKKNKYGEIRIVGRIKEANNGFKVEPVEDVPTNVFSYISLHQGLLDKVYEWMGIKRDNNKKKGITKALHDFFSEIKVKEDDYLPGMVIHSGRSKPNSEDMPQHQPFVQYSAIENAILDCKYTLVELLDFACYE